ncbi:cell division protein FtsW [Candidatus Dojkabacteria bacterium]|nr:cell division protein FtsW [Candidatus Dojkabacteria bacterium]
MPKNRKNKRKLSSFKQKFNFNFRFKNNNHKFTAPSVIKGSPDKGLLITFIALVFFGVIMVYSASFISHSKFWFFTLNQAIWVFIGVFFGSIAYFIDYRLLPKLILPGFIITITLLVLVLFPQIGTEINGARRWIDIGPVNIQPSELIKLVFIIYLAAWTSKAKQHQLSTRSDNKIIEYFMHDLLPFGLIMLFICGLVLLEPDLATAGVIGFTAICVYFMASKDKYQISGTIMILVIVLFLGLAAGILAPYRFARINTYVQFLTTGQVQDPLDDGYQLQNILVAVGSGGVFGVGFGESRQKFHYLGNTAFSDNIYAIIAEEFGFVGATIVATVFLYILFKGMKIANETEDEFGKLLVSGITIWISLQAYLHIAANIGLIPVTGIPMPYVSYGGSSLVTILIASGIILNVSKHSKSKY